jgi:hypothetical protein
VNRTLRYVWMALNLLILGAGIQTGSAFAHEQRNFLGGQYILFVGFRNEPAFEDEANGLDLFLIRDSDGDGKCTVETADACTDWLPVSKRDGDVVNLETKVLYLTDDQFNAPIREQRKLKGELGQDFFDATRYNIYFKPNVGGAYGFILNGTIQKQGAPAVQFINEKFVCGDGNQNIGGHGFSCVGDILQPFPFGANSNYRDDRDNRGHASEPATTRTHKGAKK